MEVENKDILMKRFKEIIINGKAKHKYLESTNKETRESIDTNKLILNSDATIGIKAKHDKAINILNSLIYNNTILERDELLNKEKMQTTSININKLDKIIKLFKTIKANFIKISVENDAPLRLESDDFVFYIAPSQS